MDVLSLENVLGKDYTNYDIKSRKELFEYIRNLKKKYNDTNNILNIYLSSAFKQISSVDYLEAKKEGEIFIKKFRKTFVSILEDGDYYYFKEIYDDLKRLVKNNPCSDNIENKAQYYVIKNFDYLFKYSVENFIDDYVDIIGEENKIKIYNFKAEELIKTISHEELEKFNKLILKTFQVTTPLELFIGGLLNGLIDCYLAIDRSQNYLLDYELK